MRRNLHLLLPLLVLASGVIALPGCATATRPTAPPVVVKAEPRSAYGNPPSYVVFSKRYYPLTSSRGFQQRGIASWYGEKFHGRKTSSQETYNMYAMTAAHKELPLPTYVEVHNLENGRKQIVRVNDRGPFHGDRIIDLSYAAAKALRMLRRGTAMVEIHALPRAVPARSSRPYLQAGAFHSYRNALALQQNLSTITTEAVYISTSHSATGTLHRVRIDIDPDSGKLQVLIDAITRLGGAPPYVISD